MKWPRQLTLIRHGESAYNILKKKKEADPLYKEFRTEYERDFRSDHARELARKVRKAFALKVSDYDTPLTDEGLHQTQVTGKALSRCMELPDVVVVSPYLRTRLTHLGLVQGWPALEDVPVILDDRIREQEHGLLLLYNDSRVFHVFHPEQRELHDLMKEYWYQYPQGESTSQVRDRVRSFQATLIREFAGKRVLVVTHHLTTLSVRANLERLTPEQFLDIDKTQNHVNCGVTTYTCDADKGRNGRLELKDYNVKYW